MRLTNITPIKTIQEIEIDNVHYKDLCRIFKSRKQFAVINYEDKKVHLTDNPMRLITDKYEIFDLYQVCIYDLMK